MRRKACFEFFAKRARLRRGQGRGFVKTQDFRPALERLAQPAASKLGQAKDTVPPPPIVRHGSTSILSARRGSCSQLINQSGRAHFLQEKQETKTLTITALRL
jgi:hypothetical protein